MKKLLGLLLLLALCWLPADGWCAAPPAETRLKEVTLNVGKLQLPRQVLITEFDVKSFFDSDFMKKLREGMQKKEFAAQKTAFTDKFPPAKSLMKLLEWLADPATREIVSGLGLYQVGLDDGAAFHTAWVLTVRDNKQADALLPGFFRGKLTEKKQLQLRTWHNSLKNTLLMTYFPDSNTQLDFNGGTRKIKMVDELKAVFAAGELSNGQNILEKLEWPEPELFALGKKPAFAASLRLVGLLNNNFIAAYGKTYAFGIKNKPALLAIFTEDSDRVLWTQIFDQAIQQGFSPARK